MENWINLVCTFTAFKFENCLRIIEMSLKNAHFPLQDLHITLLDILE